MKKLIMPFVLFIIISLTTSCDTDIPEVDTTPPTFSFEISGDGFTRTFTQEDDFTSMQLNLRGRTEYRFTFSGADQGGVAAIQWQLGDSSQLEFITPEFPFDSWEIRNLSELSRVVEWFGDVLDPKTGAILSGTFRTRDIPDNSSDSGSFVFFVRDFGGQSGTPNTVIGDLNISIQNSETELIEF